MVDNTLERPSEVTLMGREAAGVKPTTRRAPWGVRPATWGRRWGVILAGGDGTRLQVLTRLICGDDRPKQFCPLIGNETLLEQTRIRAERSVPPDQVLFSLTRNHRAFYLEEPGISTRRRIVQPANKGTAPPILHSLLSIEHLDQDAIVAILPCDHHYSDEEMFTAALESALDIAAERSGSVVLLGARPQGPEVEFGWIELGPSASGNGTFKVRGFCEKPSCQQAQELFQRGCLWNTFVMVGHVRAFLKMIGTALPGLVEAFQKSGLWAGSEMHIEDSTYEGIDAVNFSREVLSVQTRRLMALRLDRTNWNDLGHPERVLAVLQGASLEPWWMKKWQALRRPSLAAALQTASAVA